MEEGDAHRNDNGQRDDNCDDEETDNDSREVSEDESYQEKDIESPDENVESGEEEADDKESPASPEGDVEYFGEEKYDADDKDSPSSPRDVESADDEEFPDDKESPESPERIEEEEGEMVNNKGFQRSPEGDGKYREEEEEANDKISPSSPDEAEEVEDSIVSPDENSNSNAPDDVTQPRVKVSERDLESTNSEVGLMEMKRKYDDSPEPMEVDDVSENESSVAGDVHHEVEEDEEESEKDDQESVKDDDESARIERRLPGRENENSTKDYQEAVSNDHGCDPVSDDSDDAMESDKEFDVVPGKRADAPERLESVEDVSRESQSDAEGECDSEGEIKISADRPRVEDIVVREDADSAAKDRSRRTSVQDMNQALQDQQAELDFEEELNEEPIKKDDLDTSGDGKDEEGELNDDDDDEEKKKKMEEEDDGELEDDDDLEEGEVKDTTQRRSNQQRTVVCRFFNKGHCTWGMSCRFIHPGFTEKSSGYNMFAPSRPLVPNNGPGGMIGLPHIMIPLGPRLRGGLIPFLGRAPPDIVLPPPPVEEAPPVESAWERGLRHAKEILKKANKRKEMEPDFEEKRFNLTLGSAEAKDSALDYEKENDYYAKSPFRKSNDPFYAYGYDDLTSDPIERNHPNEYWRGGNYENFEVRYTRPEYEFRAKEKTKESRSRREKYDRARSQDKNWRDGRYVEVQGHRGRGDEWKDPWRRSTSPKRRGRSKSYSSASSRTSFSSRSSRTRSSSYSSYSRSSSGSSASSFSSKSRSRSRDKPAGGSRKQKAVVAAAADAPASQKRKPAAPPPAPAHHRTQRPPHAAVPKKVPTPPLLPLPGNSERKRKVPDKVAPPPPLPPNQKSKRPRSASYSGSESGSSRSGSRSSRSSSASSSSGSSSRSSSISSYSGNDGRTKGTPKGTSSRKPDNPQKQKPPVAIVNSRMRNPVTRTSVSKGTGKRNSNEKPPQSPPPPPPGLPPPPPPPPPTAEQLERMREREMASHRKADSMSASSLKVPPPRTSKDPLKQSGQKPQIKLTLLSKPPADKSSSDNTKSRISDKDIDGKSKQTKRTSTSSSSGGGSKQASPPPPPPPPPLPEHAKSSRSANPVGSSYTSHSHVSTGSSSSRKRQLSPSPPPPPPPPNPPSSAKRASTSSAAGNKVQSQLPGSTGAKKTTISRREELLKQLKAVEDAIARKRAKLS